MELRTFLDWIITGGAGVLAYLFMGWITWLKNLAPKPKRIAAFAISAVIAMVGYTAAVFAGYQEIPVGFGWVEKLFLMATTAFGLATLIHIRELESD